MPSNRRGSVSVRLRVWFSRTSAARKAARSAVEDVEAAAVVLRQLVRSTHDVQRGALLRALLREEQRADGEVEGRQPAALGDRDVALAPAQPAGDHQVEDQEQLAVELEHDALADAAGTADRLPLHGRDGRVHGAQEERARETNRLERLAADRALERLDVDADVGQLGHALMISCAA